MLELLLESWKNSIRNRLGLGNYLVSVTLESHVESSIEPNDASIDRNIEYVKKYYDIKDLTVTRQKPSQFSSKVDVTISFSIEGKAKANAALNIIRKDDRWLSRGTITPLYIKE